MRVAWLFSALLLSALLALFHIHALETFLYWKNVWLDVPVHFLGGLTIGVFLVGFLVRFRPVWYVLGAVGAIGGWEVFEYLFGVARESNYVFDMSLDVLMGVLGVMVVYGVARLTLWRR